MNAKIAALSAGILTATTFAAPAVAQDAEAGEQLFNRCKTCHMISDGDNVIVRGGRNGPNLYGVVGRTAGSVDGFRYRPSLVAAGEAGLVWDAETLVPYVTDPGAFLKEYLEDDGARSGMSFKLANGAEDVVAYLAQFGAEEGDGES